MASLPTSIRVGYRDYKISEYPARISEAEGNVGWHSGMLNEIAVRVDGQVPSEQADSLIHEVIHACFQVGGLKYDDEEKIVTILAHQLTQVWRDNPDFVAFMSESLSPDFPSEAESLGEVVS